MFAIAFGGACAAEPPPEAAPDARLAATLPEGVEETGMIGVVVIDEAQLASGEVMSSASVVLADGIVDGGWRPVTGATVTLHADDAAYALPADRDTYFQWLPSLVASHFTIDAERGDARFHLSIDAPPFGTASLVSSGGGVGDPALLEWTPETNGDVAIQLRPAGGGWAPYATTPDDGELILPGSLFPTSGTYEVSLSRRTELAWTDTIDGIELDPYAYVFAQHTVDLTIP